MENNQNHREIKANFAINLGLLSNVFLSTIKVVAGILGNSTALLADGINSTSDVAYYLVVKVFIKLAGKPPDPEHPYGHYQLESIAALVIGSFVITTSIAIFWTSINSVYALVAGHRELTEISTYTLIIATFTILLKIFLTIYTRSAANKTNNPALHALASDHRNDIFSASSVAIGILFGRLGYSWVDPLAGAFVAVVILKTGIEIMHGSSLDLMDTIPGYSLTQRIEYLTQQIPEIKEIQELYAHRFGPFFVVNITICINGSLSVTEGNNIATMLEDVLYRNMEFIKKVHVHYHPYHHTSPFEND